MQHQGPPLEALTHRLAETPEEFLAEPRIGIAGQIHVPAVVNDLIRSLGGTIEPQQLEQFKSADAKRDRNRLAVTLLLTWLLADEAFRQCPCNPSAAFILLLNGAAELAAQVASIKFVRDPDRREELVRFALARLDLRPAGETLEQAQDRLTGLSSAERARVMKAAREAELRARAIREALAKKAAQESADKWTRE